MNQCQASWVGRKKRKMARQRQEQEAEIHTYVRLVQPANVGGEGGRGYVVSRKPKRLSLFVFIISLSTGNASCVHVSWILSVVLSHRPASSDRHQAAPLLLPPRDNRFKGKEGGEKMGRKTNSGSTRPSGGSSLRFVRSKTTTRG